MGQKVNPIGFRLAVQKDWRSKWYATEQEYTQFLHEDLRVRKFLKNKLMGAAVSKIVIERAWNSVRVTLFTARPGLVIGRKGSEIERMSTIISKMCAGRDVKIDIFEIKQPELDAQLVAENVAVQMERRIAFRRAMKRAIQTAMDFGAEGVRLRCGGRLMGSDIARAEWYRLGKVPLQTLRVPIDYGFAEARTTHGIIGVKCWINKKEEADRPKRETGGGPRRRPQTKRPTRGGGAPGRGPAPAAAAPAPAAAAPAAAPAEAPAAAPPTEPAADSAPTTETPEAS